MHSSREIAKKCTDGQTYYVVYNIDVRPLQSTSCIFFDRPRSPCKYLNVVLHLEASKMLSVIN